jgi:hypothetical protein
MATALKLGATYPGVLPAEDSAVFNIDSSGPVFLLAISRPSDTEIANFRRGRPEFGLIDAGDIALWLYRFGASLDGDAPFNAARNQRDRRYDWGQVQPGQQMAIICLLVDRATRIVRGLRLVSVSEVFTRLLRDICQRQEKSPISDAQYHATVDAAFARYQRFEDEINAASIWEIGGKL